MEVVAVVVSIEIINMLMDAVDNNENTIIVSPFCLMKKTVMQHRRLWASITLCIKIIAMIIVLRIKIF